MKKQQNKKFPNDLDYMDAEDLAADLCGLTDTDELDAIDAAIYKKYGVDMDQFDKIMADLWPRINIAISPFTNRPMIGFTNPEQNKWLIKRDITSEFINNVIQWTTEGVPVPATPSKGFMKEITNDGVVEYEIIIRRPASTPETVGK